MADWYLAPALSALRAEANRRWPHRSTASDGDIGDTAHASRVSDHNPKPDGHGGLVVDAFDLTYDPSGPDAHRWIRAHLPGDGRVKYAISLGEIWTPDRGWHPYTGTNPHNHHVHISVKASSIARSDCSSWFHPHPQEDDMAFTDKDSANLEAAKNYLVDQQRQNARIIELLEQIAAARA